MVSKVGAKDFKRRVIGKIKQIDNTIKDDDLYFSQTARGYYLEYKPNYPNSSGKDLVLYQDLNGSISVHGNGNSFYPGVTAFEDISDFEDDTNFHKIMTRDEMIAFIKENPNVKIKHEYFSPDEYIYSKEDGEVYTEEGHLFEDWYSSEFTGHNEIRMRKGDGWESGWSLYKKN